MINPDDYPRLKDFLYILLRDHVSSKASGGDKVDGDSGE